MSSLGPTFSISPSTPRTVPAITHTSFSLPSTMVSWMSIFNRIGNHPGDRAFFDRIAHILGAERPIWLYGEDDMHHEKTLAWNRYVMLLENFEPGSMHPDIPDGSAPDVMEALKNGYSYLWKPSEQYNRRAFNIVDVMISDTEVRLTIDNEELVDEIRWRTHNPDTKDTETVHRGFDIEMKDIPDHSRFVRVEKIGRAHV